MYLPVNTRDEANPILALGGMAETFFFLHPEIFSSNLVHV